MPIPTEIVDDIRLDRSRIAIAFLGILTVVAVGVVLKAAQSVFLPLVIAWLLSYILGPVVSFMTRRKIPHGVAVFFVILLVLTICYLGAIFLQGRVAAFAAAFPDYDTQLRDLVTELAQKYDAPAEYIYAIDWGAQIRKQLVPVSGSLFGFVSRLILVIIFLLFMLLAKPYFHYKVERAFSKDNARRFTELTSTIGSQISRYLGVQFIISAATGVLVWYALSLLKVDFAITWGTLAFLLNFIPTVGSILASIPPILLAIVQFHPSILEPVATLCALLTIQVVMGNILTPKVMGDRLNLSPVVVLLSLIFWGWLWGVVGALLSIPIAAAIRIICGNIEPLKPIAVLMGSGKRYRRMESEDGREEAPV